MSFRKLSLGIAALLGGGIVWLVPVRTKLEVDRKVTFADGRSTIRARAYRESIAGMRSDAASPSVEGAAALGAAILPGHDGSVVIRAGHNAGTLTVRAAETEPIELEFRLDPKDADADGIPDAAELITREDRAAFTAWFTAIAEAQATKLDDAWATIHQDCAGLVRFAFREALKKHDRAWLSARRYLPAFDAPDVASMNYPNLPFIGDRAFRAAGDRFDPAKIEEQFTAAPSARSLWQQNSILVSRDTADARPGDLLFFSVEHAAGSRMHTMIVLGARAGATGEEPAARVVYHTGYDEDGDGPKKGEVKLVSLEDLARHPDSSWHPVAHNPRFLGVHRLIHLVHETRRFNDG